MPLALSILQHMSPGIVPGIYLSSHYTNDFTLKNQDYLQHVRDMHQLHLSDMRRSKPPLLINTNLSQGFKPCFNAKFATQNTLNPSFTAKVQHNYS